jgi:hypothetical protein
MCVIQVLYAEQYQRPDYNDMLSIILQLIRKCDLNKIYIDDTNSSFISSLKNTTK